MQKFNYKKIRFWYCCTRKDMSLHERNEAYIFYPYPKIPAVYPSTLLRLTTVLSLSAGYVVLICKEFEIDQIYRIKEIYKYICN